MENNSLPEIYRYVFDNVNDAIFIHDLAGNFLDVNSVACQRLGYSRAELLQMSVLQIDAPEFAARFAEIMQAFLQKGSIVVETSHVCKDGRRIPTEVGARFIEYRGQQAVLSVARDITERKHAEEKIHQLQEQIQNMAIQVERERLGRELHDGLGQVLGFIGLKAEMITEMLRQQKIEQAQHTVAELSQIAQTAYADMREAILGLRSTVTTDVGLEPTLREYLHRYQREWNIPTELVIAENTPTRFSPSAEIQLLRIIQEALTNVRRHSHAERAWVRFETENDGVVVTIEDHGRGFDTRQPTPDHIGLQTMRERAEALGGQLEIASTPGTGTQIRVHLPRQVSWSEQ
jgi:PAS domain S-box-containing protein